MSEKLSGEELAGPLRKAVRFLTHFVHPDGSVGGCYGTCETGFLSPYGVELLAADFSDAAALALVTRRRCERFAADEPVGWHDDLCAVLGSRIALAAAHASVELPGGHWYPCERVGRTEFGGAGLSIFSTRAYHAVVAGKKGGSIHVTWRSGAPSLEDPGVIAVFPHRTLVSGRWSSRTGQGASESTVASHGVLGRATRMPDSRRPWAKRWLRRFRPAGPRRSATDAAKDHARRGITSSGLTHDRFHREITFGDDWIRIRDRVLCRLPCRTIVCQSASSGRVNPYMDHTVSGRTGCEPIFVEGGRAVEITRFYRNGELTARPTA